VAEHFEVLTMGRVGVDLYPLQDNVGLEDVETFSKSVGGSAGNVAIAAAKHGRRAALISRTGPDAFGRFVHKALREMNVDDRYIAELPDLLTPVTFCEMYPPDHFPLLFYRLPIAPDLMIRPELGLAGELDDLQTFGFIWFELLVAASYLGVASALVETCLQRGRGTSTQRTDLATRTEGAALAIEAVAAALDAGERSNDVLARSLVARFTTGSIVSAVVADAVELLGGMAFITSGDVALLAAASHAIGFHPPSRAAAAEPLGAWFAGDPLVLS